MGKDAHIKRQRRAMRKPIRFTFVDEVAPIRFAGAEFRKPGAALWERRGPTRAEPHTVIRETAEWDPRLADRLSVEDEGEDER